MSTVRRLTMVAGLPWRQGFWKLRHGFDWGLNVKSIKFIKFAFDWRSHRGDD